MEEGKDEFPGVRRISALGVLVMSWLLHEHYLGRGIAESQGGLGVIWGAWIAGLGLSIHWSRWMPKLLHHPGKGLGFESKVAGWVAIAALPWLVQERLWLWCPLAVSLAVLALAVWMEWRWAYWPSRVVALALASAGTLWLASTIVSAIREGSFSKAHVGHTMHALHVAIAGWSTVTAVEIWRIRIEALRRIRATVER